MDTELDSTSVHISDLFGKARVFQKGKPLDERATLVKYFVDEFRKPAKLIGIRLGHYSLSDMYVLQSNYKDRLRRACGVCAQNGMTGSCAHSRDTAAKYFWYMTRTTHDA